MSTTQTVSTRRPRRPGLGSKLVNRLVLSIAGTRFFPFYGVIAHRGRHSGKIYRTPVVVRGIRGGLVVPMPWGETTDWYRNVRAARGGVIRWKGRDYPVAQPEIIETAHAYQHSLASRGTSPRGKSDWPLWT